MFEKKQKYIVIKIEDVNKYLGLLPQLKTELDGILCFIAACRKVDRKPENSYVVVNQDEPYADIVWQLIERSEERCRHLIFTGGRVSPPEALCKIGFNPDECGICQEYEQ